MLFSFHLFLFEIQDDDVNLASSTMVAEGKTPSDAMGIVISYSVRVKLNCGTLGGELVTDVPLKLMHPAPGKHTLIIVITEEFTSSFIL